MPFSRTNDRTNTNIPTTPNWFAALIAFFRG